MGVDDEMYKANKDKVMIAVGLMCHAFTEKDLKKLKTYHRELGDAIRKLSKAYNDERLKNTEVQVKCDEMERAAKLKAAEFRKLSKAYNEERVKNTKVQIKCDEMERAAKMKAAAYAAKYQSLTEQIDDAQRVSRGALDDLQSLTEQIDEAQRVGKRALEDYEKVKADNEALVSVFKRLKVAVNDCAVRLID